MEIPNDFQHHLVQVLEEDSTIVFIMSHKGEYLSLLGGSNRRFYADGSGLIGKSYPEVLVKEKADYFQSLLDEVVQTKNPIELEYELETDDFLEGHSDGPQDRQRFRVNLYPLKIDPLEKQHKIIWVIHNITEE